MNKTWWKAALVRAVKTVCQTAIATIGTTVVLEQVNWLTVVSASILAGFLSLLTSGAGLPEVDLEQEVKAAEVNQTVRIVYVPEEEMTDEGHIVFLNNEVEE